MGFNQGSNFLYVSPKGGQLVQHKKGGEIIKLGFSYTGRLKKIREKADEYQGNPLNKVELIMSDGKQDICLQFVKESWFSWGFFSRAHGIDLNKDLMVGCSSSEKNEKITFCWLKQDGSTLPKDDAFPKPDKVMMGKKPMSDWTAPLAKMDEAIRRIDSALSGTIKGGKVVNDDADLPFGDNEAAL